MQKCTSGTRRIKRWKSQPEGQDLQQSRNERRWASMTACCPAKKAWKRGSTR
ncbi:hypothetical protein GJV06_13675 [Enterobacteriaceae bacterium RIT691]|nr:hypothetical protein [Enterobacteriaceae bacterium RIT691]